MNSLVQEVSVHDNAVLKESIIDMIERNLSAIQLIAEHLDIDESHVRTLILEAVEEGRLNGYISPDEIRFYRSDIKTTTISKTKGDEVQIPTSPSLLIQKIILGTGIGLFITGQILIRILEIETTMYNMSRSLVMVGLIVFISGLCSFLRTEEK